MPLTNTEAGLGGFLGGFARGETQNLQQLYAEEQRKKAKLEAQQEAEQARLREKQQRSDMFDQGMGLIKNPNAKPEDIQKFDFINNTSLYDQYAQQKQLQQEQKAQQEHVQSIHTNLSTINDILSGKQPETPETLQRLQEEGIKTGVPFDQYYQQAKQQKYQDYVNQESQPYVHEQVPKKDDQGNPVLDDNGQPVMETKARKGLYYKPVYKERPYGGIKIKDGQRYQEWRYIDEGTGESQLDPSGNPYTKIVGHGKVYDKSGSGGIMFSKPMMNDLHSAAKKMLEADDRIQTVEGMSGKQTGEFNDKGEPKYTNYTQQRNDQGQIIGNNPAYTKLHVDKWSARKEVDDLVNQLIPKQQKVNGLLSAKIDKNLIKANPELKDYAGTPITKMISEHPDFAGAIWKDIENKIRKGDLAPIDGTLLAYKFLTLTGKFPGQFPQQEEEEETITDPDNAE